MCGKGADEGLVCSICWCLAFRRPNDLPDLLQMASRLDTRRAGGNGGVGRLKVCPQGAGLAKSRGLGSSDGVRMRPGGMGTQRRQGSEFFYVFAPLRESC